MRKLDGDYVQGTWQTSGQRVPVYDTFANAVSSFKKREYSDYGNLAYRNQGQVITTAALYGSKTNTGAYGLPPTIEA
jgi:hypothetical protein